jgi:hypothetical protein
LEGLVADLAAEMAHTALLVELAAHGLLVVAEEAGEDGGEGLGLEGFVNMSGSGSGASCCTFFFVGALAAFLRFPYED